MELLAGYGSRTLQDEKVRVLLKLIERNTGRMNFLVNDLLDAQRGKTEQVLASRASRKDKFFRIMELWGVDLYALGAASPHGHELLDEGSRVWDKIGHKHADALVQALSGFVAGGAAAEVIALAIKGLQADHPTVPALRKRIHLLAELGWKGRP